MPSLLLLLLLVLAPDAAALAPDAAGAEECNSSAAEPLELGSALKVTGTARHREDQRTSLWSLAPPSKDARILVTPDNASVEIAASLFARRASGACALLAEAQGAGGDVLLLRYLQSGARVLNATRIYLRVSCQRPPCAYHLSVIAGGSADTASWQEVALGESAAAVAYRGQPQHFRLDCREECSGEGRQLVVSAWPRDATSGRGLVLLVQKDAEPAPSSQDNMPATRGWFSGEVVSTNASAGVYYITVLRRHGRGPLPFVLSARLPETVERLAPGKPVFGAVDRNRMVFYRFEALDPRAIIEVYLTTFDGDADLAMSHSMVNAHPRLTAAQWHAKKGELVVPPEDPKRASNPTGWFHVGVFGFQRTAYSLLVLVGKESSSPKKEVPKWSELWLGAPQMLSTSPRRPAAFYYFSRLATPRLSVQIEPLQGARPDTCMVLCGSARSDCVASPPATGANCLADMGAESGQREAVAPDLCSLCWYAIFVTTPRERSRFRISLAAEGRAEPLVAGEPFRGHVDAKDDAVVFVYDLSEATAAAHRNSSLHVVLTPIYGDPVFTVHTSSQDGPLLFDSKQRGRDDFELQLPALSARSFAGAYYFLVRAESQHAQFHVQAFWEISSAAAARWQALGPTVEPGSLAGLGLPTLSEGQAQRGALVGGEPDVYLFSPVNASGAGDLLISVTPLGEERCRLYAVLLRPTGKSSGKAARLALARFASAPRTAGRWRSGRGEQALVIRRQELPRGSGALLFAVAVAPAAAAEGGEPGAGASRTPYELEVGPSREVQELPATGVPVSGRAKPGQYRRFRVVVAEPNRSLAVALRARSGESHLYLGLDAALTRGTSVMRSEAYGDNAIFVPAYGDLNRKHCSDEVVAARGGCTYFVAVLGVGDGGDFELSAQAGSGAPLPLGVAKGLELAIPRGGRRYLVVQLTAPLRPTTLEVSTWTGSLSGLRVKIASAAKAQHPSEDLADAASDFQAAKFAGVWSARWEGDRISSLCGTVADASGCAALVVLESKQGFQGQASLSVTGDDGPSSAPPLSTRLQAGVPSRAVLRSAGEVSVFSFLARNAHTDLLVSLTPLTNCSPSLQVEFPAAGNATKSLQSEFPAAGDASQRQDVPTDPRLGFASARLRHSDPRFRPGLFHFWVRQDRAALCELDVRAEQQPCELDELDAQAEKEKQKQKQVAPTMLVVDSPVFASGAHERYFLFTSRIPQVEDATKRERLAVKIETLSGKVRVETAFGSAGTTAAGPADSALGAALEHMRELDPEDAHGSRGLFIRRGFRENCGAAILCQVLVRVRSAREGQPADYLVTAVDKMRAEALLPRVPVHGCIGGACPRHRESKQLYQLYVDSPASKVRLRLSCTGSLLVDRVDACSRVMLSADSRPRLPESLETRAYLPSQRSKEGVLEVLVASHTGSPGKDKPGLCHAPCVLQVQVELRPGEAAEGRGVHFELVAAAEDAYSLLLDGDDPVSVVLRPRVSEYFLFDSRRASPFLTLIATVPYDREDPQAAHVSMYVLGCGQEAGADGSDTLRPSSRHHDYRARVNPRGQLVAQMTGAREKQGSSSEERHCYYRIGLRSRRRYPVTLTLRGFDWRPHMTLSLNQPLQSVVPAGRSTTFEVQGAKNGGAIVLGLEVCSGSLRLQAGPGRPTAQGQPVLEQEGGLDPRSFERQEVRRLKLEASGGELASYVLSAEHPDKRHWLRPTRTELSAQFGRGGELALSWGRAWLYSGAGPTAQRKGADIHPDAEYEVFYARVGETTANLSAPCGLYLEYQRRKMSRIFARARRRVTIGGLHPGHSYVFNVVARSYKTGTSVAYTPVVSHGFSFPASGGRGEPTTSSSMTESGQLGTASWGRWEAMLLAGAAASALVAWVRPLCREEPPWRRWELELPSWPRRSARTYQQMEGGYDTTPALLGQSDPTLAPYHQC